MMTMTMMMVAKRDGFVFYLIAVVVVDTHSLPLSILFCLLFWLIFFFFFFFFPVILLCTCTFGSFNWTKEELINNQLFIESQ